MDLRAQLIEENSKEMADRIAAYVVAKSEFLTELMDCFFDEDLRICQRASWPMCKLGIRNPDMLVPYIEPMLANLDSPKHDAVVRNTLRVWAEMDIPETYEGEIYERCLEYISSPKYAVAIRAFAISVAAHIAMKYPELGQELREELLHQQQHETKAAIRFRIKKYISIL